MLFGKFEKSRSLTDCDVLSFVTVIIDLERMTIDDREHEYRKFMQYSLITGGLVAD